MATGDFVLFQESKALLLDGGWLPTDDIKVAILNNTTTPTAADVTPALTDYTEVGTAGTYIAAGTSLGNIGTLVTQASGIVTFDSATNPSWAVDALNDVDAYWALVYNATAVGTPAIGFVDLGGPVDMSAITLTLTWNASGLFTIT